MLWLCSRRYYCYDFRMVSSVPAKLTTQQIRISAGEVALFTEELATLLNAHLELDRALTIMLDAKQPGNTSVLLELLHKRIHEGKDFSAALAEHPQSFSPTYINLIRAGEIGGNLAEVVDRLSTYLNMMNSLRDRITSAVIYPAILLVVASASLVVVLGFVLPQFEVLFTDMGIVLPWITRAVIAVANFFNKFWGPLLGLGLLCCFLLNKRYRNPAGRVEIDGWLVRLPLLGNFIQNWETARFARNLSVLTQQGVPLSQSISIAADAIGNRSIAERLHLAAGELRLGGTISSRLLADKVLPRQAAQMIRVGEESGELAGMLDRVAVLYDRKVGSGIERGLSLLEPVLVLERVLESASLWVSMTALVKVVTMVVLMGVMTVVTMVVMMGCS